MSSSGFVGMLSFELFLPDNHSLKEKRRVLLSVKAQLARRFGASVAEVDHHDVWQRARLTLACVGRDYRDVEELLEAAVRYLVAQGLEPSAVQRDVVALDDRDPVWATPSERR